MARPFHEPLPALRRQVETMAGYGVPEIDIARVIGIDPKTLRKQYRDELDTGHVKANVRVAENLYRKATGEGREAVTAAIFWLKTPAGWKETSGHEVSGRNGGHFAFEIASARDAGAQDRDAGRAAERAGPAGRAAGGRVLSGRPEADGLWPFLDGNNEDTMRGRKPRPTGLKLVAGNPGKRPLNKGEPRPDVAIPTCPAHLNPSGKAEWKHPVQQLHALDIISQLDRAVLAAYCQAFACAPASNPADIGSAAWNKET